MMLLEIKQLKSVFDGFTAVNDVSLSIKASEFFTLTGLSGFEKTTLQLIAGLDVPVVGRILLDGLNMTRVIRCFPN